MKRLITLIALICTIFTGCAKQDKIIKFSKYNDFNSPEHIIMEFVSIETGDKLYKVSFTMVNNTDEVIMYGTKWLLEVQDDNNNWCSVELKEQTDGLSYAWNDVLLSLDSGVQTDITVSLYGFYETPLPKGSYRLVQLVGTDVLLSVNFTV